MRIIIYIFVLGKVFHNVYKLVLGIQSLANLLQRSETVCKPESAILNPDMTLYKEFCDYLSELESKKRLLIKPDCAMTEQEKQKKLFENESLPKMEYSMKKSTKPLIEMISEDRANFNETKQILQSNETEKKSHDPQNISYYNQEDVSI